ncbi:MAG: hypothetical protein CVU24_03745 [Betaproteobacteria bacterium HGW-Betaproteobacteria-18]|nr:MAG: hypothetical protein CVU24_03745 [Betaproteobacteria bacterium HGW-Betaproteobacteria-18]
MSNLQELSQAVRLRRTDMGLTQTVLAKLSGLSRATVNQVEQGSIKDLSLTRASRLLGALGLGMAVEPPRTRKQAARAPAASALSLAAQMANVSFRNGISAEQLQDVICHTSVPMHLMPQVYTFLEEAPVSLLARVVEELHSDCAIERWQIWQNMRDLARSLKSSRALWV